LSSFDGKRVREESHNTSRGAHRGGRRAWHVTTK
jgi:hypothetical protein